MSAFVRRPWLTSRLAKLAACRNADQRGSVEGHLLRPAVIGFTRSNRRCIVGKYVEGVDCAERFSRVTTLIWYRSRARERGDVPPRKVVQWFRQFDQAFDPAASGAAGRDEGRRAGGRARGATAQGLGPPALPGLVRLRTGASRGQKRFLRRGRRKGHADTRARRGTPPGQPGARRGLRGYREGLLDSAPVTESVFTRLEGRDSSKASSCKIFARGVSSMAQAQDLRQTITSVAGRPGPVLSAYLSVN